VLKTVLINSALLSSSLTSLQRWIPVNSPIFIQFLVRLPVPIIRIPRDCRRALPRFGQPMRPQAAVPYNFIQFVCHASCPPLSVSKIDRGHASRRPLSNLQTVTQASKMPENHKKGKNRSKCWFFLVVSCQNSTVVEISNWFNPVTGHRGVRIERNCTVFH
jgi:hypothetical protein